MEKLIIFDCDGVLVDSEFIASKVFAETLSKYGYPLTTEEAIHRFTGINEKTCRDIIMKETDVHLPEDYWTLQRPALMQTYETELKGLLHPVLETLKALQIPCCVASNSSRNHVIHCLKTTKQHEYFTDNSIFTSQQVSKPKPAPDLFLYAAKEMGVSPQHCIVVEDSTAGAHAALAAGMQVMMFMGGSHARLEFYQSQISLLGQPMLSTCHELLHALNVANSDSLDCRLASNFPA